MGRMGQRGQCDPVSNYIGTGADGDPVAADPVMARLDQIIKRLKEEESRRRWTLLFTIGGALFAAVRLGIVTLPHIRRLRSHGELASNPRRRRR